MMEVLHEDKGENWVLYNGDSCEVMKGIPDNSVHFSVFSPPFSSLYTYSNSDRDLGNSKDDATFFEHFDFIVKELYRILMPGRNISIHCMNPGPVQCSCYQIKQRSRERFHQKCGIGHLL